MIESLFRTNVGKFPLELQTEPIVGRDGSPPLCGEGIGFYISRTFQSIIMGGTTKQPFVPMDEKAVLFLPRFGGLNGSTADSTLFLIVKILIGDLSFSLFKMKRLYLTLSFIL